MLSSFKAVIYPSIEFFTKPEIIDMSTKEILNEALKLKPEERFTLVESLIKSLDEPDKELDEIWAEEAEKRLKAYRKGRLEGVEMGDIFREK